MSGLWITLSTRWNFSTVQATLSVIITLIFMATMYAYSRFWRQRGIDQVRANHQIPLSQLVIPSSAGEAWDIAKLMKWHVFSRKHIPLQAQLIVVLVVTTAITLAGVIASYSLRTGSVVRLLDVDGHQATTKDGTGPKANRVSAQVLWDQEIKSLDAAGYPRDQLLDFVPSSTIPWAYKADEWDPTWTATYEETEEQSLTLTANPDFSWADSSLRALPAFRDTVNLTLLNETNFRSSVDFCGWLDNTQDRKARDFIMFVLLQSTPSKDNRTDTNKDLLFISISAVRIHDAVLVADSTAFKDRPSWRLNGTIGNSSYTRVEATFSRKTNVANKYSIPWPWTNDTTSIAMAYADYHRLDVTQRSANNDSIELPAADDLLRFYQAYMAIISTGYVTPATRRLSVTRKTVDLSTVFLAFVIALAVLASWGITSYTIFYQKNKQALEKLLVPFGILEWMMYAVKSSLTGTGPRRRDHEHLVDGQFQLAPDLETGTRVRSISGPSSSRRPPNLVAQTSDQDQQEIREKLEDYSLGQAQEVASNPVSQAGSNVLPSDPMPAEQVTSLLIVEPTMKDGGPIETLDGSNVSSQELQMVHGNTQRPDNPSED